MENWEVETTIVGAISHQHWERVPGHVLTPKNLQLPTGMPDLRNKKWSLAHEVAANNQLQELPVGLLTSELLGLRTLEGITVARTALSPIVPMEVPQLLAILRKVRAEMPENEAGILAELERQRIELPADDVLEVG